MAAQFEVGSTVKTTINNITHGGIVISYDDTSSPVRYRVSLLGSDETPEFEESDLESAPEGGGWETFTGTITLKAKQYGTPSPEHPAAISPAVTIAMDDSTTLEVYGGELDILNKELTVTHFCGILPGDTETWSIPSSGNYRRLVCRVTTQLSWPAIKAGVTGNISSHFVENTAQLATQLPFGYFRFSSDGYVVIYDEDSEFADITEFKTWLAGQVTNNTPVQTCYLINTPEVIQLSDTELQSAITNLNAQIRY